MIKQAKYIKLGRKGKWEPICLEDGTLRLGYYEVPHEVALTGKKEAIRDIYMGQGKSQQAATNYARQVLDFYQADAETVWITFSNGFMWWCYAQEGVEFLGQDKTKYPDGSRLRRTAEGWSNLSLTGQELRWNELSGRLTRTASFRGTTCEITDIALEYLDRKINGQELPAVEEAKSVRQDLQKKAEALISLLTWQDFELFVDILFAKSGWVRVSETGKTMKDIDIELILPVTGERALVQVKSKTDQTEFDSYAKNLQEYSADKIFYIYHTPACLFENKHDKLNLMNIEKLADAALRTGLTDWLIEKV